MSALKSTGNHIQEAACELSSDGPHGCHHRQDRQLSNQIRCLPSAEAEFWRPSPGLDIDSSVAR